MTEKIIGATYKVHNTPVSGFLDIIVDGKVFLGIKAVKGLSKIHEVQLLNYLKATSIEVGLLINFGRSVM